MRRQRSLNRQLVLLGTVPAVLMFIVLLLFFTSARLDDARRELFNNTQVIADSLAPAVEYAVISGNRQALEQILNRTIKRSGVSWVQVYNNDGKVVGARARSGEGIPSDRDGYFIFDAGIDQQPVDIDEASNPDWLTSGLSGSVGTLRIGDVEVAVSGDSLAAQRREIIVTSLLVALVVLAITIFAVGEMAHRISRPIQRLSASVRQMTERRYDPVESTKGAALEISDLEENLTALALNLGQLRESRDKTLALKESARAEAVSASDAKSQFLAMMSHELRTPLNGIMGMLDLVGDDPVTERQRDYIKTARQATDDLLTVISDILDFSRMEQGALALNTRTFDLRQLIENCTASYRHECEMKGVELLLDATGTWPENARVQGDAARLRQILAHLIGNACKFTEEGTITVRCEWQEAAADSVYLGCEVCDSGTGIPAHQMGSIFNSFEQLDGSSSRSHGGTGIGLTLVQGLVELMGGHVRVESDLGKGSLFYFELPFLAHPPAGQEDVIETGNAAQNEADAGDVSVNSGLQAIEGQSRPQERTLEAAQTDAIYPPLALVVEDNEVNQRVAMALLKHLGFETVGAENGQLAVALVTEGRHTYDLVLMDCQMPIMDGYEATRCIREWEANSRQPALPVIAITADALPGTDTACQNAGMNDYIAKPIRKDQLAHVLERWVRLV